MLLDRVDVGEELETAIQQQDMIQVQRLVRANPLLISAEDEQGRTPLHSAAIEANVAAIRFLVGKGADVNAQDRWGRTALFLAVYEEPLVLDRRPTVALLLEMGADVNARDNSGDTPLHMAAFGETELVTLLLEHGADVNAVNNAGETPLHKAVRYPEYEVVRELLRHGGLKSIRDNQGLVPVQIAEQRGLANLVELLSTEPT